MKTFLLLVMIFVLIGIILVYFLFPLIVGDINVREIPLDVDLIRPKI